MKNIINKIVGLAGTYLALHSGLLNDLVPLNEKECYIGLLLIAVAFRKIIIEDIKDMFF